MFTYAGMMIDCMGTSIAAMIAMNTGVAPVKRSLANANPADVLTTTMIVIESTQTIIELTICWPTGSAEVSAAQLANECPRPDWYWSWVRSDVSIMNQNG